MYSNYLHKEKQRHRLAGGKVLPAQYGSLPMTMLREVPGRQRSLGGSNEDTPSCREATRGVSAVLSLQKETGRFLENKIPLARSEKFGVNLHSKTTQSMTKKELRIVFMGTPEFAVASLKALVEGGYHVVGVITTPDKPAGRGYKLQSSAVKEYALSQGLLVLQPERLKNEVFLSELKRLQADVQVVVAFRMLPEVVWNMPPKGTFNLHASLLPQYRGSAPINWAIINGERETGVTTFFLAHEIDTGEIIFQEKTAIRQNDNAETLHGKLMQIGSELVIKTVEAILADTVSTKPQHLFIE